VARLSYKEQIPPSLPVSGFGGQWVAIRIFPKYSELFPSGKAGSFLVFPGAPGSLHSAQPLPCLVWHWCIRFPANILLQAEINTTKARR